MKNPNNINKYSVSVLAKWICYSDQSVQNWYDGKTMPQPQVCLLIAEITKDTPQDIFEYFKSKYMKYWGKAEGTKKYLRYKASNYKYVDKIQL